MSKHKTRGLSTGKFLILAIVALVFGTIVAALAMGPSQGSTAPTPPASTAPGTVTPATPDQSSTGGLNPGDPGNNNDPLVKAFNDGWDTGVQSYLCDNPGAPVPVQYQTPSAAVCG